MGKVFKQLTANFSSTNLLENSSVSGKRHTGEKSPAVRFVDSEPQRVAAKSKLQP